MNFLRKLLDYKNICIQCHNNPDADTIASAFGVHLYLQSKGVKSSIVYGGALPIKKSNMKTLIRECDVPVQRLDQVDMSQFDLLLLVDCQKGQGNVEAVNSLGDEDELYIGTGGNHCPCFPPPFVGFLEEKVGAETGPQDGAGRDSVLTLPISA